MTHLKADVFALVGLGHGVMVQLDGLHLYRQGDILVDMF